MKIVDKYLIREHLIALFYCLTAFIMIHLVYDLFYYMAKIIKNNVPVPLATKYFLFLLVPRIEILLPASLLLSTLYVLWLLTRNNELTALRASGVSLYRTMIPFMMVGFALSVLSIVIKECVVPRTGMWIEEFEEFRLRPSKDKMPGQRIDYVNTSTHRQWHVEKYNSQFADRFMGVSVIQERETGRPVRLYTAKMARWLDGEWWFYGLKVQKYNEAGNPVGTLSAVEGSKYGKAMPSLRERPTDLTAEIKQWELLSTHDMVRYLRTHKKLSRDLIAQKRFELHDRIAMPWACFIVTLFAIPAGAKTGRQNVLAGIFLALACFFGFYALSQVGLFLGHKHIIWPWLGAWLSNIVFLTAGTVMVARLQ